MIVNVTEIDVLVKVGTTVVVANVGGTGAY